MTDESRSGTAYDPALPSGLQSATDPELLTLVRAGDNAAYEQLFLRHRAVALRYARRISDAQRAEDLCAEAFAKILDLLQRGKGPDVAFRAYLLTTVRTSHLNTIRSRGREDLVPDHEPISRMMPIIEDPDARFDQRAICRAFYQLPERWQAALWLTAVEGFTNDEVGDRLGIKSNAVASLAFRARAGLRQAYLAEHLLETTDPACRRVVEQLPAHLRGTTSSRRRRLVEDHLETCRSCATAAVEIAHVDSELGALLAPLLFAGFAVGGAALIVPAKASGLAALGAVVTKVGALGKGQAVGAAAPGIVGTKVVVAASITALGLAVGSQVIRHHPEQPAPRQVTATAPERLRIVAEPLEPRTSPVDSHRAAAQPPTASPAVSPSLLLLSSVAAPTVHPAPQAPPPSNVPSPVMASSPKPSTSAPTTASPNPSTSPSAQPTPTATPPVATRSMAVGSVSNHG
ncbi:MAG: polymerase subunit sigma, partial [Marmoricola sp.]|nr:polymerase subunit sigma [Marmoricola sp.]